MKKEYSFSNWYSSFSKESVEAIVVQIPNEVMEYLEHGSFRLPLEAVNVSSCSGSRWSDGTCILLNNDDIQEDAQSAHDSDQPTFPEFSKQIQHVLNNFGAVFVKLNWSAPLDAAWVTPTKTLRCTTLEEVYLLLKSSDRLAADLNNLQTLRNDNVNLQPNLVLKKWREMNPCTEFRCFVIKSVLAGICQRDLSQYYRYIESEKYDIRRDIKSLFNERIRERFESLTDYTFDVIRYRKDRVKIIDFGPYCPATTKTLLFTPEDLAGLIDNAPEFRFIGENVAIQPNDTRYFCVPREINEFYESSNSLSPMDIIQREVETQAFSTGMNSIHLVYTEIIPTNRGARTSVIIGRFSAHLVHTTHTTRKRYLRRNASEGGPVSIATLLGRNVPHTYTKLRTKLRNGLRSRSEDIPRKIRLFFEFLAQKVLDFQ